MKTYYQQWQRRTIIENKAHHHRDSNWSWRNSSSPEPDTELLLNLHQRLQPQHRMASNFSIFYTHLRYKITNLRWEKMIGRVWWMLKRPSIKALRKSARDESDGSWATVWWGTTEECTSTTEECSSTSEECSRCFTMEMMWLKHHGRVL